MKIFQTIRGQLIILGIEPVQSTSMYLFNRKLLTSFLIFVLSIVSTVMYLVFSVTSMLDYILCFSTISSFIGIGLCFAIIVLQKTQLLNYMERMEELINQSEWEFNPMEIWYSLHWARLFQGWKMPQWKPSTMQPIDKSRNFLEFWIWTWQRGCHSL